MNDTSVRELDRRAADGLDIRLLWNSATGQVTVTVHDTHSGDRLKIDVDGADALVAFHHPFAYAAEHIDLVAA